MPKILKPSRRDVVTFGTAAATALCAPYVSRARADTIELTMLAWYGHGEPDVVGGFEAACNVKIRPTYYAGGDSMMALISQQPPGTYDVILSDAEYVPRLHEAGHIEEMNPADYPFDNLLYDDFRHFPGHWQDGRLFAMIVRFGFLGVSYNATAISQDEAQSYEVFWKKEIKGRLGHFDWHLPNLGQVSLANGNGSELWNQDAAGWEKIKQTTMSLRPQVGGFFDYGGTFHGLRNEDVLVMAGIGDWITGVLQRDGVPVRTVVPKQGGIQWTESYSIGKGTPKADTVRKFIQYMLSPKGQVHSACMLAYPANCVTRGGRTLLGEKEPWEAERSSQIDGAQDDPIRLLREGRIHYRGLPRQQSLQEWSAFWQDYKAAA
jgi:spermidine/putrescine transport system substrate-binding protein